MKELGKFLEEKRIANGVSIEEAAEDLGIADVQLESIESGNIRAFQDVYTLKEYVKSYAKYLGLDPEKVLDEFNDFLFEHTSKISLSDILEEEAKRKEKEKVEPEKKVISPYTKPRKQKKVNPAPIVLITVIMILLVLIIYLIMKNIQNTRTIDTELVGQSLSEEVFYEYTY